MDHTRFEQWKRSWLTCGRILLTLAALTIFTLVLYLASQNTNLLHTNDDQTHSVRYRRDKNSLQIVDPDLVNIQDVPSSTSSSDGNNKIQHENQSGKTLSITSVINDSKTLPSDKSEYFDAITHRSVDGGNKRPMTQTAAHDKYKMKRKRKKIMSTIRSGNGSDIKLPKNSIRAYKNVTDVNGLENFSPDIVMDENRIAATNNVRHKKDQLIIREDQGVVIVRKYTCVPCQRVPGQRTSIKTRPKYRGMFLVGIACC